MKKLWHFYPGWATTKEIFQPFNNYISNAYFYDYGYSAKFSQKKLPSNPNIIVAYSLGCLDALTKSIEKSPQALILFSPFLSFSDNNIQIIKQLKAMKIALQKDSQSLINNFHQTSFISR